MDSEAQNGTPLSLPDLPPDVRALAETLEGAGYRAHLVGRCVRELLGSRSPDDFELATSAPAESLLELFPQAIPTRAAGELLMVPTPAGPVDVTPYRPGPDLRAHLAHRDFTIHAMAHDPIRGVLLDPFDGRSDLAKGELRSVGSAAERFAEDALRALRAARLAAVLGLEVHREIEAAMPGAVPGLRSVARERVRRELTLLLLAPRAGHGLGVLRRGGIEADLAPGVSAGAHARVDSLPGDLTLRLAAWLAGTNAGAVLRALRFPRPFVLAIDALARLHPIERNVTPLREGTARRLLRRAGTQNLRRLVELREAELALAPDPVASERLYAVERVFAKARHAETLASRRVELALDGRAVMEQLGCEPGPTVGRALRFLTDRVLEDPSRNTPETLRSLLDAWAAESREGR